MKPLGVAYYCSGRTKTDIRAAKVETFGLFARYLEMTFLIEAKKDGRDASAIRALVPDALDVAQKLVDDGWTVSITCPEGGRYWPNQFDLLRWKYGEMPDIPRSGGPSAERTRLQRGKQRKPWSEEDIAQLQSMARRYPTKEIARQLGRGVPATVMMAHTLKISLRLRPKKGSGETDLRVHRIAEPAEG